MVVPFSLKNVAITGVVALLSTFLTDVVGSCA